MQMYQADEIREAWGNKPCDHPTLQPEYILGGQTGDYVCTVCGKVGPGPDWNKKSQQQKNGNYKRLI